MIDELENIFCFMAACRAKAKIMGSKINARKIAKLGKRKAGSLANAESTAPAIIKPLNANIFISAVKNIFLLRKQ